MLIALVTTSEAPPERMPRSNNARATHRTQSRRRICLFGAEMFFAVGGRFRPIPGRELWEEWNFWAVASAALSVPSAGKSSFTGILPRIPARQRYTGIRTRKKAAATDSRLKGCPPAMQMPIQARIRHSAVRINRTESTMVYIRRILPSSIRLPPFFESIAQFRAKVNRGGLMGKITGTVFPKRGFVLDIPGAGRHNMGI